MSQHTYAIDWKKCDAEYYIVYAVYRVGKVNCLLTVWGAKKRMHLKWEE